MRRTVLAVASALILVTTPSLASDSNYNATAASNTQNDGRANCHSATMRDGCDAGATFFSADSAAVTEAPLPLAGSGLLGMLLLGGAGTATLLVRRRERHA